MAQVTHFKTKEFNSDNLVFAVKKRNMIPIFYKKDDSLIPFGLHTSEVSLPFGCSQSQFGFSDFKDYYITAALNNYDSDKSVIRFKKTIEDIENSLVNHVLNNYSTYFSTPCENLSETVCTMLTPTLKQNNVNYPPSISFGIPRNTKNGVFDCDIYNSDNKTDKLSDDNILEILPKHVKIKCAINCVGAWTREGKKGGKPNGFGLKWELCQAKVMEKKKELNMLSDDENTDNVKGYAMLDDE